MKIRSLLLVLSLLVYSPDFCFADTNVQGKRASIVATINGEMITALELEKNVKLALLSKGLDPAKVSHEEKKALEESVLNDLIKESIIIQEAKAQKIDISDGQVIAEIQSSIDKAGISKEQFYADLAKQGYTEDFYKEKIRKALMTQTLINRNVLRKIIVSNDEILDFYLANGGKVVGKANVALLVYGNSADMDKYAQDLIDDADDFEKLAQKISVGPYASEGGVFGEMAVSDLATPIQSVIQGLEAGEVSPVFTLNGAYAQVKVLSKTTSSDNLSEMIDPVIVKRIQDGLRSQKAGGKIQEYVSGLEKKAIVNIR